MTAEAPLRDIVVVELGHNVAAPFAGKILGDLGATVIKVEKRDGDDARKWAPPYWHGHSALFQSLNRNKLSVVVDLRDAGDRGRLDDDTMVEASTTVIVTTKPVVIALHCATIAAAILAGDDAAVERAVATGDAALVPSGVTLYSPPFTIMRPSVRICVAK